MFKHIIIALIAGLSFTGVTLAKEREAPLDRMQTNSTAVSIENSRSSEKTVFGSRTSRDDRRILDSGDYYDSAVRPN